MNNNLPFKALYLIISLYGSVWAQTPGTGVMPSHNARSINIFFDNDYLTEQVFKGLNEDRNYTMGLGIAYSSTRLNQSFLVWPNKWLGSLMGARDSLWLIENPNTNMSKVSPYLVRFPATAMVAATVFTPDNLALKVINSNDRPYSSFVFFSTRTHWLDIKKDRYHQTSIEIGALGLFLAREVQKWIHRDWFDGTLEKDPIIPQGWHLQISNGGELAAAAKYERRDLLAKWRNKSGKKTLADVQLGGSFSIGYNTYAAGEIRIRLGLLNPGTWAYSMGTESFSLNTDLEEAYMRTIRTDTISQVRIDSMLAHPPKKMSPQKEERYKRRMKKVENELSYYRHDKRQAEFFAFGAAKSYFVAYNAHLQGLFKESVYILSGDEINRVVPELIAGLGFKLPLENTGKWSIIGNASIHWQGKEFRKPLATNHVWGTLNLGLTL